MDPNWTKFVNNQIRVYQAVNQRIMTLNTCSITNAWSPFWVLNTCLLKFSHPECTKNTYSTRWRWSVAHFREPYLEKGPRAQMPVPQINVCIYEFTRALHDKIIIQRCRNLFAGPINRALKWAPWPMTKHARGRPMTVQKSSENTPS